MALSRPVNQDKRIDAYIARSAPFAQPILIHLRQLVHRASPEIEETIKWSHPTFLYRGKLLCRMAAFKAHAGFGFWHQGVEKLLNRELGKTNEASGLIGRITSLAELPADRDLLRYLKTAIKLSDEGAPSRPPRKPKPALPLPADLAAALKKNRAALTTWDNFSPSHRREYIEWITEAKRPVTRAQRLATTLEWLAAGKPRNWKYLDC
jgi:uncharacterized protein YdeI (YjbR/CyaY-like superfamily)